MKRIVLAILLAGCGTSAPQPITPAPQQIQCITSYFYDETQSGFNLPAGLIGPEIPTTYGGRGIRAEWSVGTGNGETAFLIAFDSYPTSWTLQEVAAYRAQYSSWTIERNEPITVNSGQQGWLIVSYPPDYPNDLYSLSVILVQSGRVHSVTINGSTTNGTYDPPAHLGIARTVCAQ